MQYGGAGRATHRHLYVAQIIEMDVTGFNSR